jgi:hypothetical protein
VTTAGKSRIKEKIDHAYLQLFLKGKQEGINEYKKIANSSDDRYVLSARSAFYQFDRKKFIDSYCVPLPTLHSGKIPTQIPDSLQTH